MCVLDRRSCIIILHVIAKHGMATNQLKPNSHGETDAAQ